MRQEQDLGSAGGVALAVAGPPSPALPDINAETYPFEVVQHLLDQAAHFNLFSVPAGGERAVPIAEPGGGVGGLQVRETLHRFDVRMEPPEPASGVRARDLVGEVVGSFESRWLFIPGDLQARPGGEPRTARFDPSRPQRFAMLDGVCRLGERGDGFRGFGTGSTFPGAPASGGKLLAGAVGNLTEGFGRFAGLVGTYTYNGALDPDRGFTGNLFLRVIDPRGALFSEGGLAPLDPVPSPEPEVTWLLLRGQKSGPGQKTQYRFGEGGRVIGLDVEQDLRLFTIDFSARGHRGLRATRSVGPVVGRMTARIGFDFLNPGAPGTGEAPIPFQSFNQYTFFDACGGEIGGFSADGNEGRTFTLDFPGAPGQRGLRFGGFGPILDGTGPFAGVEGLMTDNSVVGIAPHALATSYVLRIHDPEGRFRAALAGSK